MKQHKLKETEIGKIPADWEIATIEGIKAGKKHALAMGPFGSNITKDNFVEAGVPVIRGNNLTEYRFSDKDFVFVTESKAGELAASVALPEDIVITHRGTLGQVGIIPKESNFSKYVVSQSGMKISCDTGLVNPQFVFYFLKSPKGQYLLLKNTSQTGVPAIAQPLTSLRSVAIPLPQLDEQNEIVGILSSLDDLVELNRKISANLEKIGQALFKHWFVDFEFLNEKGNPYRSSGGKMVDSELGEIPEGWVVGTLGDICDITMGQSPPGHSYNEDGNGLPFYQGIADFGFRFPSRRVYCTAPSRFAEEGDVLLSVRAPVGTFNVTEERCAIGRGLAALRLKEKHNGFLYYLLRTTRTEWEKFEAEGTVFGSVTKSDVHDFKVVIPPQPVLAKFALLIEVLEGKININEKESRNLTAIRDSLLPRLMSGRIRVGMSK